jgi:hypothetical protein
MSATALRTHMHEEHKIHRLRTAEWTDNEVLRQHQQDHRDPSQWTHDHQRHTTAWYAALAKRLGHPGYLTLAEILRAEREEGS